MKKNVLYGLLSLCMFSYANAQETKTISEIVVKANNLVHVSRKPFHNYYALGGEVGIYFKDKIYVGLAQYSSLAPSDVLKNNLFNPDKTRVYEYSLQGAYKFDLNSSLYLYTGLRAGYGAVHMEYRYNNGVDTDETITREQLGSAFVMPDIKVGMKLHKYIALEAGANYRYYFGGNEKWGVAVGDLRGLGFNVSLVGKLPL